MVRIRLYDYARLPPSRLDWAKQVALYLLEQAGVRTVWLDCRLSQDDPVRDAEVRDAAYAAGPSTADPARKE